MQAVDNIVVELEESKAQRLGIILAFSEIIQGQRKDAIEYRLSSGIEEQWREDEDHYEGIDNVNQGGAATQKGRTPSDGLRDVKKDAPNRSTVFLKITRPYVDAGAARVSDMLLPTDDRNWALKPEPRPELTEIIKQAERPPATELPPQQPVGGLRGMMGKMFGGQAAPAQANAEQPDMLAVKAKQAIAKAKASAERAQEEIDDWLVQCRYHAEVRRVIEGAAKVGTGILKGPHPVLTRKRSAKQGPEGWTVEMLERIAPTSKFVSHWNLFPDGACGEDIQRGRYVFENDDITARGLIELKADPSYIKEMIDLCIEDGPISPTDGTRKLKDGERTADKDLFQIWYYHGQVSKKDMEAAGCKCKDKEMYPAVVTMVNDRVIKVTLSPLDSGEFPYDVMVWQAKVGHWAGVGIGRQMRECQKGANAAVRNLMDNAGLGAGPQIIVDRSKIVPANGKWELTPRKIWYTKADEEGVDVTKAFTIVTIPILQADLMAILQFWLKEAEDVTGMPMLLQGQQGKAPDTLGGMQIMNNNGSTVLRRIARTYDDRVTEPHIGRYFEWLLLYGPDEAKGQFSIDARGSSALVERDMQSQQLMQLTGISLNPAYGLDPELVIKEFLKSMRFDVKSLELSDEKKREIAQRQPPEDPRITAAKINQDGALKREQLESQQAVDHAVANAHLALQQQQFQASEGGKDRALAQMTAQIDAQLASTTLASQERRDLEKQKVLLASLTIKINAQKDLSLAGHTVDLHKHQSAQMVSPAVEPAGQAPAGQAFQR